MGRPHLCANVGEATRDEQEAGTEPRKGVADAIDGADGRLDDAEAMFSAIISREPAFAEAWNKRATVRFFRGDDAGSANDILQVIKLEPRHFGALSGLGMIKVRAGDFQGALQAYRAAQRINPFLPNIEVIIDRLGQRLKGRAL